MIRQVLRPTALLVLACAFMIPAAFAQDRFAAIDDQLRRGEWIAARDAVLPLIEAARTRLEASEMAGAVARLALAEAGMGQTEDALWHWHVAQNLDRSVLSPEALAAFGPPGELLARHPLRQRGATSAGAGPAVLDSQDPRVRPGRRVQGSVPQLSVDIAALPAPLALRFQIIIGPEGGRPRDPVVVDGGPPGMVWEILESMRGWRYLPAYKGRQAVAVTRVVSVNTPPASRPGAAPSVFQDERAGVEALLRAGRWQDARERAQSLLEAILERRQLQPEDLAVAFTLRALAEAGLGLRAEALCRWQAAQFLDPSVKGLDLSAYGPAGEILADRGTDEIPAGAKGSVEVKTQSEIKVPHASRLLNLEGTVALAATVGPDGGIRQPRLLQTESLGQIILEGLQSADGSIDSPKVFASQRLAISALDAVCDWRVRSRDSAPVQTILTVPFKVTSLPTVRTVLAGPRGSLDPPNLTPVPRHNPQGRRPQDAGSLPVRPPV